MPVTVLCVGEDASLLRSRAYVLETLNATVVSATPDEITDLPREDYEVAVFCHSVSDANKVQLGALLRSRNPGIRLVALCATVGCSEAVSQLFDQYLASADGPRCLLRTVERLLTEQRDTRSQPSLGS